MPTCPDCGLPEQAGSCAHCGAVVDDSVDHAGGEPGGDPVGPTDTTGVQDESQESAQGTGSKEETTPVENGPSTDSPTVSRRKLLAGSAGAAAVATGGWYFLLRGPTGAKAVARSYVSAVQDNDWAGAEGLFHDESPMMSRIQSSSEIDTYEDHLEEQGTLSRLEELDPSIDEVIEWRHIPDVTAQAAEDVFIGLDADAADHVSAAKRLNIVVEVNTELLSREENIGEHLSGDSTKSSFSVTVVKSSGDWSLWRARPLI